MQIRLIMQIIPLERTMFEESLNSFLTYVQRFDIVSPTARSAQGAPLPDPVTKMHVLRRSTHADGSRLGDVIPLSHLRAPVHLIPRFFDTADTRLTKENSLEYCTEFYLNKFFSKYLYYCLQGPEY